jgi:HTH-type transcriptional regulator / antitoxin MqsA
MAMKKGVCPICVEGELHEQVKKNLVSYAGCEAEIDAFYSICDACGSEQANAAQARANKRSMIKFKKCVDGLLIGSEVRVAREKLGIKQSEAARIFGGGPVAFSKYEKDDVMQSEAMDRLLRVATRVPGAFEFLAERAGYSLEHGSLIERIADDDWERLQVEGAKKAPAQIQILEEYAPEHETDAQWTAAQA